MQILIGTKYNFSANYTYRAKWQHADSTKTQYWGQHSGLTSNMMGLLGYRTQSARHGSILAMILQCCFKPCKHNRKYTPTICVTFVGTKFRYMYFMCIKFKIESIVYSWCWMVASGHSYAYVKRRGTSCIALESTWTKSMHNQNLCTRQNTTYDSTCSKYIVLTERNVGYVRTCGFLQYFISTAFCFIHFADSQVLWKEQH